MYKCSRPFAYISFISLNKRHVLRHTSIISMLHMQQTPAMVKNKTHCDTHDHQVAHFSHACTGFHSFSTMMDRYTIYKNIHFIKYTRLLSLFLHAFEKLFFTVQIVYTSSY